MLTIDIRLQGAVERALAEQIEQMVAEGIENPEKPQDVEGGAAVVIDIATGDILASASYPSFDITRFNELFNELNADEMKPMLNRALSGIYSPGSTSAPSRRNRSSPIRASTGTSPTISPPAGCIVPHG